MPSRRRIRMLLIILMTLSALSGIIFYAMRRFLPDVENLDIPLIISVVTLLITIPTLAFSFAALPSVSEIKSTQSLPFWRRWRQRPDNRANLITNVRVNWIQGVLEPSLVDKKFLELARISQQDAVKPIFERKGLSMDGATLPEAFEISGRQMLILGAPGSGKTIALLQLAEYLLEKAEKPASKDAVPAIFNLSSWDETKYAAFQDWLVERLNLDYNVSKNLARRWIEDGSLIYLLDGLDEVKFIAQNAASDPDSTETKKRDAVRQSACLQAINAFWEKHVHFKQSGLLVCSRSIEFTLANTPLRLENAVELQPLPLDNAESYLTNLGTKWDGLRQALKRDHLLRQLARSPLTLNIMTIAYEETPVAQINTFSRLEDQENDLFERYISRCLTSNDNHYSQQQTRHYLAWFARRMNTFGQTVFYIEGLQLSWLENPYQQRLCRLIWFLVFGTFGVLGGGLANGLVGILLGVLGIGIGFTMGDVQVVDRLHWSWRNGLAGIPLGVLGGGLGGGIIGFVANGLIGGLIGGLTTGLVTGLLFVLVRGLVKTELISIKTVPNEGIWRSLRNSASGTIIGGIIFGLLGSLTSLPINVMGVGLCFGLFVGGEAVIKHLILRGFITLGHYAPFNLAAFLDYIAENRLLRKVGGGYIFRHRLLMEYFAQSKF